MAKAGLLKKSKRKRLSLFLWVQYVPSIYKNHISILQKKKLHIFHQRKLMHKNIYEWIFWHDLTVWWLSNNLKSKNPFRNVFMHKFSLVEIVQKILQKKKLRGFWCWEKLRCGFCKWNFLQSSKSGSVWIESNNILMILFRSHYVRKSKCFMKQISVTVE